MTNLPKLCNLQNFNKGMCFTLPVMANLASIVRRIKSLGYPISNKV